MVRFLVVFLFFFVVLVASLRRPLRIFAACAFHGREWATAELCQSWKRQYETYLQATDGSVLPEVEWIIVSDVNRWGIQQARDVGHACSRSNTNGVDLNRNYPIPTACKQSLFHTELVRNSTLPDGEEYAGPDPFSEAETRSLVETIEQHAPIDIAFFVHTGDELVLTPFDACWEAPENYEHQLRLARWLNHTANLRVRAIGAGMTTLYPATGTATDYVHSYLDVPFVFTLETYRLPTECADLYPGLSSMPTAEMNAHQCRLTFVPRHGSDCDTDDLSAYVRRWSRLFDAILELVRNEKDRETLWRWIGERQ